MMRLDDGTDRLVFIIFHVLNAVLVISSLLCSCVLRGESAFDQAMAQLFIFGALFTMVGSKAGGYLGAVMEEDSCALMDMGVLSTMGAFIGATVSGLIGTALVGLYFFVSAELVSAFLVIGYLAFLFFSCTWKASIHRLSKINCCGIRLSDDGKPLPVQPIKMKNKMAVVLAFSVVIEVVLTVLMFVVMRRDFTNSTMLGGMAYAMSGAMLGGLMGGWLAGLLDKHTGQPEHDNPIMVCGMALMGGMMGAMPAAMVGGMNALMGAVTIIPTILGAFAIFIVCYLWMYRSKFRLELVARKVNIPYFLGGIKWQKQS